MNWPLEQFEDKSVVFVGVGQGRSMNALESFIIANANVVSFEGVDKQDTTEPLEFLKQYDADNSVFIKNEGIPGHEMPVPYVTPINIFFACIEKLQARTVGITGTKGKSTTAALTADMIRAGGYNDVRLAGNIGTSVFEGIETATKDTVFVIELSSYQLSDVEYSPSVAACINLYNDHADWHGSVGAYWEAKHNIIHRSQKSDLFVYNPAFPELERWAQHATCRTIAIDPNEDIDLSRSSLYGDHNKLNALIARLIAREFDVPDEISQQALDSFHPLPHRMEFVAEKDGHIFIDDAIGMTPESTTASINAILEKYGSIGCLFLGGTDRGYDFREFFKFIEKQQVPNIILFPDTIAIMRASMPESYRPNILEASDMRTAVRWAHEMAPKQSVVLLSTAAPSYSLWKKGFEEKGRQFKQNVLEL